MDELKKKSFLEKLKEQFKGYRKDVPDEALDRENNAKFGDAPAARMKALPPREYGQADEAPQTNAERARQTAEELMKKKKSSWFSQ